MFRCDSCRNMKGIVLAIHDLKTKKIIAMCDDCINEKINENRLRREKGKFYLCEYMGKESDIEAKKKHTKIKRKKHKEIKRKARR